MNTRLVEHGNKNRTPAVSAKIKLLAEILATTPGAPDYQALAKLAGYRDAHAVRQALRLPQNIKYLREHKRQVLDDICMHNPERLRKIADAEGGNPMAKVAAIRGLELMQNGGEETGAATPRQSAGMTIVIESGATARVLTPPTIDAEPEAGRHAWPSVD